MSVAGFPAIILSRCRSGPAGRDSGHIEGLFCRGCLPAARCACLGRRMPQAAEDTSVRSGCWRSPREFLEAEIKDDGERVKKGQAR